MTKCIICSEKIKENYGKLKGTLVKNKSLKGTNYFIYVCSDCQKKDDWIEKAKVRGT